MSIPNEFNRPASVGRLFENRSGSDTLFARASNKMLIARDSTCSTVRRRDVAVDILSVALNLSKEP